jgi:hypothetical protein
MWWQSSVIIAHMENLTTLWDLPTSLFDSSYNVPHRHHVECHSHITFIYIQIKEDAWRLTNESTVSPSQGSTRLSKKVENSHT